MLSKMHEYSLEFQELANNFLIENLSSKSRENSEFSVSFSRFDEGCTVLVRLSFEE